MRRRERGIMLMWMFILALSLLVLLAGQAVAEEKAGAEKVPAEDTPAVKQKMSDKEKLSYSYGYEIGKGLKNQPGNLAADVAAKGVVDAMNAAAAKGQMTDQEKLSYSHGYEIGKSLKRLGDLDPGMTAKGMTDAFNGRPTAMSEQEMRETLHAFKPKTIKELGEKNKKEGEAFLAENKKKEGVVTLPSGLQYKVIKEGTGRIPKGNEKVRVHYRGAFIDGTEFANTYKEGDEGPWIVYVNDVVPGWSEALKLMKVGSKWQIFIPASLAFGERGNPPNVVLIYDLELLSIH
jgi:FKBP-type peptidyl-prolyl cis-trans isomerase